TGTLTIGQATPTLTIDPTPLVYTGLGQGAVVSALGVDQATPVAGQFTITYEGDSNLPVNAGTYDVAVTLTRRDPHHNSTSTTGTLTIVPATPSIGLGNDGQWQFTYDGTPKNIVGSAVGWDPVNNQYISIDGTFTYDYYNEYGSNTQLFGPPLPGAPTD